jgi:hypothetical protein
MNILEIKIKTSYRKEERRSIIENLDAKEENEEILKLLFKNIQKGNAYPNFVNLFFRYSYQ